MDLIRGATQLLRDIDMCRSQDEILAGVRLFTKDFGIEQLTIMRKLPDPDKLSSGLIHTDAPASFVADFDKNAYARYTPLITRAEHARDPFTAAEVRNRRITEQEVAVLDHIHEVLDLTDGVVVPVRSNLHGDGIVMFGGHRPKLSPMVNSMLAVLGVCIYGRIHDLMSAFPSPAVPAQRPNVTVTALPEAGPETCVLTSRERECLNWVAKGKTDFEIGIILSISARTARFHIENAKRKLGVATRVQAVTRAIQTNAIAY